MKWEDLQIRSDEELVALITKGETEVFSILVERYYKKVFSLVFKYFYNFEETEDITQEVFLKCFTKLHKFNFKASFNTWLYRVAVNVATDFYNNKKKQKNTLSKIHEYSQFVLENKYKEQNPFTIVEEQDKYKRIIKALESIHSMKQKNIFILKHLEGLSIREISEITKMSESTVKTHLLRCLEKIRDVLGEKNEA